MYTESMEAEMAKTEDKEVKSRADILALKATGELQRYAFKIPALKVVVSPKGATGFEMRFRRPGGKQGMQTLGPLDRTNRKPVETPVIGQPLTPEEAITLASF